ncbi:hypothetical protein ABZ746_06290 [Streptomyces sp. NPDC020096]
MACAIALALNLGDQASQGRSQGGFAVDRRFEPPAGRNTDGNGRDLWLSGERVTIEATAAAFANPFLYLVLGFFVLVWAYALGYWRLAKVERPWAATSSGAERAGP